MQMRFPIARRILSSGLTLSVLKLLLIAAISSRPWTKAVCRFFLRPFVRSGEIPIYWNCRGRRLRIHIRMADLLCDFCSIFELAVCDIYRLDPELCPDLIIDGGGNTGLFTLNALGLNPHARVLICEPVPRNIIIIKKHLELNDASAEILPVCIGGTRGRIAFYEREANLGSFDPTLPYVRKLDVQVLTLDDLLADSLATSILIKLDIEGMEVESLRSFVRPMEKRKITVVGELHNQRTNKASFADIFSVAGWELKFYDTGDPECTFHATSHSNRL
jgi:FkbM family methyltransferase